jgi:hypothetical protein
LDAAANLDQTVSRFFMAARLGRSCRVRELRVVHIVANAPSTNATPV